MVDEAIPGHIRCFSLQKGLQHLVGHIKIKGIWMIKIVILRLVYGLIHRLVKTIERDQQNIEVRIERHKLLDALAKGSFPRRRASRNADKNPVNRLLRECSLPLEWFGCNLHICI